MGNDALKAGLRHKKKFYLRQAIEQYGKGLEVMVRGFPMWHAGVTSSLMLQPRMQAWQQQRHGWLPAFGGCLPSTWPCCQPTATETAVNATCRPQCEDAALNSILCSNRAHVNLLLGNFRNAYQDGLAALRHNDQNIKVDAFKPG